MMHQHQGNSADAQRARLLAALREGPGGRTSVWLRDNRDILHPAGRVLELRRQGYRIVTCWDSAVTACGKRHRVGRYVLLSGSKVGGGK